jgi:hypothetical protein
VCGQDDLINNRPIEWRMLAVNDNKVKSNRTKNFGRMTGRRFDERTNLQFACGEATAKRLVRGQV